MVAIGILGLGMCLPRTVRTNDWWPDDVVASWKRPIDPPTPNDGASRAQMDVCEALRLQEDDPFGGTVKRHVLADQDSIIDLQAEAAKDALSRSGSSASEIDLILSSVLPTDFQGTNSACELHERLGLPRECLSLHVDGAQHAFLLQLSLAESMIAAGRARRALLVQASAISRLVDANSPMSPRFGDGATAAVVGPVAANRGILSSVHRTDGRLPNTLVASVPGKRWYDDGRVQLHLRDPVGMRDILLRTLDVSKEGIEAALVRAGLDPRDVDLFVLHQGTPWLTGLVQRHAGLTRARTIATVQDTAHLFAAFVPATLVAARDSGLLVEDDVLVVAGGGNGMTYGATVLRWGR